MWDRWCLAFPAVRARQRVRWPGCLNINSRRSVSAMSPELINLIVQATFESLYMVGIAALLGTAFGLPLGVFLATSRKGELFAAPTVNRVLGIVVNATR